MQCVQKDETKAIRHDEDKRGLLGSHEASVERKKSEKILYIVVEHAAPTTGFNFMVRMENFEP